MFCYQGGHGRENDDGTIGSVQNVYLEESTEGKMEPELRELESSSSAGTGFEAPGQQCFSDWEMERIAVDGCLLVDGSLDLGETLFPSKNSLSGRKPIDKL